MRNGSHAATALALALALALAPFGCTSWSNLTHGPAANQSSGPVIGQPAPEIEGPDCDGAVFKLSDARGQVVLLDFWGNW
jgi:cytochrome oxidase Cu insertion factor (SCO1/SenC/PrrC family)